MSKRPSSISITGRDRHIVIDALATALVALEQLSAQAKCRIRHDLDFRNIYREYGIETDEESLP
jgi:hypothetical protein